MYWLYSPPKSPLHHVFDLSVEAAPPGAVGVQSLSALDVLLATSLSEETVGNSKLLFSPLQVQVPMQVQHMQTGPHLSVLAKCSDVEVVGLPGSLLVAFYVWESWGGGIVTNGALRKLYFCQYLISTIFGLIWDGTKIVVHSKHSKLQSLLTSVYIPGCSVQICQQQPSEGEQPPSGTNDLRGGSGPREKSHWSLTLVCTPSLKL